MNQSVWWWEPANTNDSEKQDPPTADIIYFTYIILKIRHKTNHTPTLILNYNPQANIPRDNPISNKRKSTNKNKSFPKITEVLKEINSMTMTVNHTFLPHLLDLWPLAWTSMTWHFQILSWNSLSMQNKTGKSWICKSYRCFVQNFDGILICNISLPESLFQRPEWKCLPLAKNY